MKAQRYLLDTNVLSSVARGRDHSLIERFRTTPIEEIAISTLSAMEIEFEKLYRYPNSGYENTNNVRRAFCTPPFVQVACALFFT